MNREFFWKNFNLREEIEISGNFIYDALRQLHEMESFHFESDCFDLFYKLAVGIERLLKVSLILLEHDHTVDEIEFERSLITHSHRDLFDRVRKRHKKEFAPSVQQLVDLLSNFYKSHRYGRYNVNYASGGTTEKKLLCDYLEKYLGIKINDESSFKVTPIDTSIREFMGKQVKTIALYLFEVVQENATRLNIYTDEVRSESKAAKVFLWQQFDFQLEQQTWRELIVYFLLSREKLPKGFLKLLEDIGPLDFDPGMIQDYLESFGSDIAKQRVFGEIEALSESYDKKNNRLQMLSNIGDKGMNYFTDEDDDLSEN